MVFGFIGPTEVIVILVIALLVFGPQKLPEIGRQIGSAYREMNRMRNEVTRALEFDTYVQPYDMPTYEAPANGQTYAHGNYDYNYDSEHEAQTALQIAPPGPRLEQDNVRMLSESEMSGSYTEFEVHQPEVTGAIASAGEVASESAIEAPPVATAPVELKQEVKPAVETVGVGTA